MADCTCCPRRCGVDRESGKLGFCGVPENPVIARAAPHFGEEPCISGERGSGAVFFSGCTLRCVFCQNYEISRGRSGKEISVDRLRDIFLELRDQGVHNIELVTPTHFTRVIAEALDGLKLDIPVVWNSSGYEKVETLQLLDGLVQIYMPDLKYLNSETAKRYSAAEDYPEAATAAIAEMVRQRGSCRFDDDGLLQSGVLIRHLILTGHVEESMDVIDYVADSFLPGTVLFSLMSQYTPVPGLEAYPELCRTLTPEENDNLIHYLRTRHLQDGFWQELSSVGEESIPLFDGSGLDF